MILTVVSGCGARWSPWYPLLCTLHTQQTDTGTHTDRHTDRQTDTQTHTKTDSQIGELYLSIRKGQH